MRGQIFRHFAGGYVKVLAKNVEDLSYKRRKVIVVEYCDQNGEETGTVYAITQKKFFAKVPKGADNPTGQRFIFEEVDPC